MSTDHVSLEDPLLMTVCGPCAKTCLNMEHVRVFEDNIAYLSKPFVCQCARILKSLHSCCWSGYDVPRPQGVPDQLPAAWAEQAHYFLQPKKKALRDKLAVTMKGDEPVFTQKLKSSMELFAQYNDLTAQAAARAVIPVSLLQGRAAGALEALAPEDRERTDARDELFKQLLFWFKDQFFAWVDAPLCPRCGAATTQHGNGSLTPTPEETANWATTVEGYVCTANCADVAPSEFTQISSAAPIRVVRFPRYNKATRLLTWRKGRCGEWTNCFLLLAISLGFECRYVLDFTDHVWVEVYSYAKKRWVHADPCEKAYDMPHMYEEGWKKALTYVFAFSHEECVDVIRRYSQHAAQLTKRRAVTERFVQQLVTVLDSERSERVAPQRVALFHQRRLAEIRELYTLSLLDSGDVRRGAVLGGRTTGSDAWRRNREEDGHQYDRGALTEVVGGVETELRALHDWQGAIDVVNACQISEDVAQADPKVQGLIVKGPHADIFEGKHEALVDLQRGFILVASWKAMRAAATLSSFGIHLGNDVCSVTGTLTTEGSHHRLAVVVASDWSGMYRGTSPPLHSICKNVEAVVELTSPAAQPQDVLVTLRVVLDHLGGLTCVADIAAPDTTATTTSVERGRQVQGTCGLLVPLPRDAQHVRFAGNDIQLHSIEVSAALQA